MEVAKYEWRDGAWLHGGGAKLNPNPVGLHLELLRKKSKGELTPQDVVDDAKHNNSPLHSFFEWNDGKAAEQHRLAQARSLIRAVVAVYVQPDKPAQRVQAFVHIPERGAPHYRSTHHAMSQRKTRELILRQAWREFQSWRRKYERLEEFSDLFEFADELGRKLLSGPNKDH